MNVSAGTGRVAIRTLVRQCDDIVVGLHELGERQTEATVSGRSGACNFALLAHWTGAETPLRFVSGTTDAVLVDGRGSAVHLELGEIGAGGRAR